MTAFLQAYKVGVSWELMQPYLRVICSLKNGMELASKNQDGTGNVMGSDLLTILIAEKELICTGASESQLRDMVKLRKNSISRRLAGSRQRHGKSI